MVMREPVPPIGDRRPCHRAEVAGHHQRAADFRDGKLCSLCDRLDHQSFERTLAQLTEHRERQELLLVLCGAGQQLAHLVCPIGHRTSAARPCDALEYRVDFGDRQFRGRRRREGHCLAQGCRPEADASLAQLPREKCHGDLNLIGLGPA
jgi:hypothetical protein